MNPISHRNVCLSIVSHGQGELIRILLGDLLALRDHLLEVIITLNIPEDEHFLYVAQEQLPIRVIRNQQPKGFGANHNAAFSISTAPFFAVVNPDIRLENFLLDKLLSLATTKDVGVVAPIVYSSDGQLQDSARLFPTLARLAARRLGFSSAVDYNIGQEPIKVDWIAGMFMVFKSDVYKLIGGFDERYFMYFEDVDLCYRLHSIGLCVILTPQVHVIHDAQRASRREVRYLLWHIRSACRFLLKT